MDTIKSVTRLPVNAFSSFRDVPAAQDKTYTKAHACTRRALRGAIKRVRRELEQYATGHGNGAVCAGWIETPFGKMNLDFAGYVANYEFSDAAGLRAAMDETQKTLRQIHDEWDAEAAAIRADNP